jgi:lipopolysaccharide transport system ATP-binding protein
MLREALVGLVRGRRGREDRENESVYALNGVSFSVAHGEVLGIIGRNGAGKSTLLKILSRITHPTSGSMIVRGRVASLLEVGTGFHEELTGLENIYLSGSILGMNRKLIESRIETIVDFAGIPKFLHTPIKRYSSGMRLRLGFAVAAHLESDVLLVDEVLAVGDVEFQKKCLEAMDNLHTKGKAVLFVSHNLAAIEHLCSRAIWIDAGRVRFDGDPKTAIRAYMATFGEAHGQRVDLTAVQSRRGNGDIVFTGIEFLDVERHRASAIASGDSIVVRLYFEASKVVRQPVFGLQIHSQLGTLISYVHTHNSGFSIPEIEAGAGHMDLELSDLNLLPGRYYVSLWLTSPGYVYYDVLDHCATLDIQESTRYGLGLGLKDALVGLPCRWSLHCAPDLAGERH